MENIIYLQLLGEGTTVYRPVPASKLSEGLYKISENEIFDPDDEEWEFLPGTVVKVEQRILEGETVLVAVKEQEG